MEYSYYGRNDMAKPKKGLEVMALEEIIVGVVTKQLKIFKQETNDLIKELKCHYAKKLKELKKAQKDEKTKVDTVIPT